MPDDTIEGAGQSPSGAGGGTPERGFPPGTVLAERFVIGAVIGEGAFGTVHRAEDRKLDRQVAIKILHRVGRGGEDVRRFLDEARLIARLDHPGILAIHDAGVHEGVPWLCMRLVAGESLLTAIAREGPLSAERTAAILAQAARALDHAHRHGIIHRDVKPSNLLVARGDDGSDRVWVVDFGLAKTLAVSTTSSGVIKGTPGYMAPELITGRRVDGRADLFGLACTGFEALTGRHAFQGVDLGEILFSIVHSTPREWSLLEERAGRELADVLRRALAKSPEDRWSSGEEMARALERAVQHGQRGSRGVAPAVRSGVVPEPPAVWDETNTVDVHGLRKSYTRRKAVLTGVDLRIERGSIYALLGRNGSGKTTLIRTILGLARRDAGRVAVFGRDPWRERRFVGSRVGYVPETYNVYPDLRVRQVLDLLRSVFPSWNESLSLKLLDRYGLSIEARVRELSRGGVTQLSLIGALAHRPDLLVLDDPTLGLDAVVLRDFFETLQDFSQREGTTVLISSHNLDEVERIATHVGVLKDGRLQLACPVEELARSVQGVAVTFRDDPPDLNGMAGWRPISSRGRRVKAALVRDPEATLERVRAFAPESVDRVDLSLRDVFVALTR